MKKFDDDASVNRPLFRLSPLALAHLDSSPAIMTHNMLFIMQHPGFLLKPDISWCDRCTRCLQVLVLVRKHACAGNLLLPSERLSTHGITMNQKVNKVLTYAHKRLTQEEHRWPVS